MLKPLFGKITENEIMMFVNSASEMIRKYGWENENVHPHGYPMNVCSVVRQICDWGECTRGSKEYLVLLANGLAKILNAWEEYELAERIQVRSKANGKVLTILKRDLDMFRDVVELV